MTGKNALSLGIEVKKKKQEKEKRKEAAAQKRNDNQRFFTGVKKSVNAKGKNAKHNDSNNVRFVIAFNFPNAIDAKRLMVKRLR